MRYIDKDATVAEIERRLEALANTSAGDNREFAAIIGAQHYELISLVQYIDTLEVKEEVTTTDAFIKKAKEAFCKATCNGHPPRSTCTSLGTCKEYDNFVKLLKRE